MASHRTALQVTPSIQREFHASVIAQLPDLTDEEMQRYNRNKRELGDLLRTALMPNGTEAAAPAPAPTHPEPTQQTIRVRRDYGQSVKDLVKAGEYDWKNDDVNDKHFPHDRSLGVVEDEVVLVHFNRTMSSDDVERELDGMGLKPADHVTLLGIGSGESTRDLQRQFPVVALGSVASVVGGQRVAYLLGSGTERFLGLRWRDVDWSDFYRFAAVRK